MPTLFLGVGIVGLTTGAGAVGGAALGSLALGIGAVPGGMFGAPVGLEAGVGLLNVLGVGFLADYLSAKLPEVHSLLRGGLKRAWEAPDSPYGLDDMAIDAAAHDIARGFAVLFSLIVQAAVASLMAKGAKSVGERLPEVVGQLRTSKLGADFAQWFEQNHARLTDWRNSRMSRLRTSGTDEEAAQTLANKVRDSPGYKHVIDDLSQGPLKFQGAKFQLERITEESQSGLLSIEDKLKGLPAADAIRTNGDVLQFKSIEKWSKVQSDILGSFPNPKIPPNSKFEPTVGQAYSDAERYKGNGWQSGTHGIPLSGKFEYQIDGDRLLDKTPDIREGNFRNERQNSNEI